MRRPGTKRATDPTLAGDSSFERFFGWVVGAWIVVTMVKLGNPVILDHLVAAPNGFLELLIQPWPLKLGAPFLVLFVFLAFRSWVRYGPSRKIPISDGGWIVLLPLVWLGWQLLAGTQSVDGGLTRATLLHFIACVTCFYAGYFVLGASTAAPWFWRGMTAALAIILWFGLEQHFGGLAETAAMIKAQPDWEKLPQEFLKRLEGGRIFSTLAYPNALAGAILVFLPPSLVIAWRLTSWLTLPSRWVVVGAFGLAGLGCLYWTGSKSGWLVAAAVMGVAFLHVPWPRKLKLAIVGLLAVAALGGFFVRYAGYFERGATSVSARVDYWQAAVTILKAHPVFGSGPGTFGQEYAKIKRPESEMARLTHNDYLQQASDSGLLGGLSYALFVFGSIGLLYRKSRTETIVFASWLGLFGWSLQSFSEYTLYIPAIAWPVFLLLGWLWSATQSKNLESRN